MKTYLCESCLKRRVRCGSCFFCEKPVCCNCSDSYELRVGISLNYGDRVCSIRCAKRYMKERRCRFVNISKMGFRFFHIGRRGKIKNHQA